MREKDFQTIFGNWVRSNLEYVAKKYGDNIVWELKICKEKAIRFDAVRPHQVKALLQAKKQGLYYKINDMPFIINNPKMRFTNKKPFDCFFISKALAYVVIFFYKLRQRKGQREMVLVDIEQWLDTQKSTERKSIRQEELKLIGNTEKF